MAKIGAEIFEERTVSASPNMATCRACACPGRTTHYFQVRLDDVPLMERRGFRKELPPPDAVTKLPTGIPPLPPG